MSSAKLEITAELNSKGIKKGVSESKRSVKSLGTTMQTALGFSIAQIGSKIVGLFKNIIVGAVRMSAKFEDLRIIFRTMISDIGLANKTMADLKEFSIKTPFTPEEVFKASKALIAFGFSAKEQIGLVRMLGDVSAATGKPLEELAFIYGKVFSRGKAQARELNQLIMAGVPIVKELAKVLKKPREEIANLSKQGKISFSAVKKAFKNMTSEGGIFFNLTETRSKSLSGRWSTLKGATMDLGRALGDTFGPSLQTAMNVVIGLFGVMTTAADKLSGALGIDDSLEGGALNDFVFMITHPLSNEKDLREFRANLKMLREGARINEEALAKNKRKPRGIVNVEDVSDSSKGSKNPMDKFFQQGQFMFDPLNIPKIDVQERQLNVLEQIASTLVSAYPGGAEGVIRDSAGVTFNAVKNGMGAN